MLKHGKKLLSIGFATAAISALLISGASQNTAQAAVSAQGSSNFPGAPQIDFGPSATGQVVNGSSFGGVFFKFSIAGSPSSDATIGVGPGNTNHISGGYIEGNALGDLSLLFPSTETTLGYGFALNDVLSGTVIGATTITLYNSSNGSVGSLSYSGTYDPTFIGGFAGIQSTIPFVRADVAFTDAAATRFAFDNVYFSGPVPEPGSVVVFGCIAVAGSLRRRRRVE